MQFGGGKKKETADDAETKEVCILYCSTQMRIHTGYPQRGGILLSPLKWIYPSQLANHSMVF